MKANETSQPGACLIIYCVPVNSAASPSTKSTASSGKTTKANSHIPCRAHAVLRPCHAVSFLKVRVVAGNIRTANAAV
jgi:hypothetical protein